MTMGLSAAQFGSQSMSSNVAPIPAGFSSSGMNNMSVPMGGMHGQIDYTVDMSQAEKVSPAWAAQNQANIASRHAAIQQRMAARQGTPGISTSANRLGAH